LWDIRCGKCEVGDWGLRFEMSVGIVVTRLLWDIRGGRCEVGDWGLRWEMSFGIVVKKIKGGFQLDFAYVCDVFCSFFENGVKSLNSKKSIFFSENHLNDGGTNERKTVQNGVRASWDGIGR
jgi:hypothetical protein